MKQINVTLVLITLLLGSFQVLNAQIYEKKTNQNVKDFVSKIMPESELFKCNHEIIETLWGDESLGEKIVFFYTDEVDNHAVVLQPVGLQKDKYALLQKVSVGTGDSPQGSSVLGVFFEDVLDNGIKEMVVITKGESCKPTTADHTAISDDDMTPTYQTQVFQQAKDELGFQLIIEAVSLDLGLEKLDLQGLKTEAEVRQSLQQFKTKLANKGQ